MNDSTDIYDFIKSVVRVFRNYDTPDADQLLELACGNVVKITFSPIKRIFLRDGERTERYSLFTGRLHITSSDDQHLGVLSLEGRTEVSMVACAMLMTQVNYEPRCVKDYTPWSEPHEPEYIPTHWDG